MKQIEIAADVNDRVWTIILQGFGTVWEPKLAVVTAYVRTASTPEYYELQTGLFDKPVRALPSEIFTTKGQAQVKADELNRRGPAITEPTVPCHGVD